MLPGDGHSQVRLRFLLRGDDVQGFDTRWDEVLLLTEDVPSDKLLGSVYKWRIRKVGTAQDSAGIKRSRHRAEKIAAALREIDNHGAQVHE